jgi:protein-disulfide isomerase
MRKRLLLFALLLAAFAAAALAQQRQGQEAPDPQLQVRRRLEAYLRYFYAWGDDVQVNVGPLLESSLPGISTTLVEATQGEQKFQQVFLVGAQGRLLIRGEILDTTEDPYARTRAINLVGSPSKGPADAPVTIVEYGDFQCPTCAQVYPTLKKLMAERKDVRLVFKDLPLVGKHDWAYVGAVAGQCAFQQSPEAFWALHDFFFENQAKLNVQNLDAHLDAFAARRAGLDAARFRTCRDTKATSYTVDASLREAAILGLANTPTLFINGRPLIGNQPREILDRLINFEVALYQAQKQQQGSAPR